MMKNLKNSKAMKWGSLAVLAGLSTVAMAQDIHVNVNGQPVVFAGTEPQMMGGSVMIPLRGVFERLGATVDWRESDQSIIAKRDSTKVELRIGDRTAWVNGKAVSVPTAPTMYGGSTLVPIRFVSEALGAQVNWDSRLRLVSIDSIVTYNNGGTVADRPYMISMQPKGSVLPVKLDERLSSGDSEVGDKFTATIDTKGDNDYFGLPTGTKIEGHVSFVQAKKGDTPGVLGLKYDSILMADGTRVPIEASMIGLDNDSVTTKKGRIMVKDQAKSKDDMKYVGTGAGAGVLLALATKGNVISNAVIGGALGYLYQHFLGNKDDVREVELKRGQELGVKLKEDVSVRVYGSQS